MATKGPGEVEIAPKESVKNALLEVWDRIDEEEDGILSVREIRDKLMSVVPGISVEVRDDVMQKLTEGALMLHGDGNAAFEEEQFVRALFSTTCGFPQWQGPRPPPNDVDSFHFTLVLHWL